MCAKEFWERISVNQTTKKQHYIWRSYLAPWTRDNSNKGQIFCRREGRIFPVSLMNVAHENYFYEVKEPSKREIELIYDVQAFNALEWNASNEMVFAKESEYLERVHTL